MSQMPYCDHYGNRKPKVYDINEDQPNSDEMDLPDRPIYVPRGINYYAFQDISRRYQNRISNPYLTQGTTRFYNGYRLMPRLDKK